MVPKTIQDCIKVDGGPHSSHLENKISKLLYCIYLEVKLPGKSIIRTRQRSERGPLKMDTQHGKKETLTVPCSPV